MTDNYQHEITTLFGDHVTQATVNLSKKIRDGLRERVTNFKNEIGSTDDNTAVEFQREDVNLYLDLVLYFLQDVDPLKLIEFLYTRDEFKCAFKERED